MNRFADNGELQQTFYKEIVRCFLDESIDSLTCEPIHSGFSGAEIIRVSASEQTFALRCWPENSLPRLRILTLHGFLKHLHEFGLPVAVPILERRSQLSLVRLGKNYWQLEPWLLGEQITGGAITDDHVQSMMQTIAKMHCASELYRTSHSGTKWFITTNEPVPAIIERIELIERWTPSRLARSGEAIQDAPLEFRTIAQAILANYQPRSAQIRLELKQLSSHHCELFTCWRDLWRDHILFSNKRVTGIIDASAARYDHVGTDISRLLGSLFGDNQQRWAAALVEYQRVRPLSELDLQLIRVLDRSSVLLSGMTWLQRWEKRLIDLNRLPAIVERMQSILQRMHAL